MAWTLVKVYGDHNVGVWHVLSSAANDIELVITHGFKSTPLWLSILPHNAQANAAGYWIDDIGPTTFHLHKPNGGAGSVVHVMAWTLRDTPWIAGFTPPPSVI